MNPDRWMLVTDLFTRACEESAHERLAWLDGACPDPALRHEVAALLETYETDPEFLEQAVDADAAVRRATDTALVGRVVGHYRIVRAIGRGGMGVVYEAVRDDQEFDRRAAIKILPVWSGPGLAERFRFERRVLAGLDHEGIARLIDGGTTEDGVLYFVMEYVEGQPIDAFCRERHLSIPDRLALVDRVLDAVAYAHHHLVIHRDVKPANILVTPDGRPKLLDFGIAAMLSADEGVSLGTTRTGLHRFTPDFASPEQIGGQRVTTASDVYSLGALVYVLLSGQRPYVLTSSSPLEALRTVCEVDPAPMSLVADAASQKWLRGDLDRVVAKALAKSPSERYESVAAFAADLRACREGRPVSATPQTWTYLARRFAARHRTAALAAGAVAISLLVGGLATAWQAGVARTERDKAQNRFNQVRQFSRSLLFDVHNALRPVPGATEARRLLLDRAVQFLDGLATDAGGDPQLIAELAEGYFRLGSVQGDSATDNLGDVESAAVSFGKAAGLVDQALAASPGARDRLILGIDIYSALASALDDREQRDAAGRAQARHLELLQALEHAHGQDPIARFEVANGYTDQGVQHATRNNLAAAKDAHAHAVSILESLPAEHRSQERVLRSYTLTLKRLGAVEMVQGALEASERHYRLALNSEEELLHRTPGNSRWRFELSYSLSDLGLILSKRGDDAGAIELWGRAFEIRQAALAADPRNSRMVWAVASIEQRLGGAARRLNRHDEAVAYARGALAHYESLPAPQGGSERTQYVTWARVYLAEALLDRSAALPKRPALMEEARLVFQRITPADAVRPGSPPSAEFATQYESLRSRLH